HESGEAVEWEGTFGEPANIRYDELYDRRTKLGCAALLLRGWSSKGSRHTAALIVGGFLARAGWDLDDIKYLMRAIATEAGDEEVADRIETAADSHENFHKDEIVAGLPKLRELIGEALANKIAKLLGYIDHDAEVLELNKRYAV